MLILISGTSGSGKSSYAEDMLQELKGSPKIYIAAAKVYDDEMRLRVERHKARRIGKGFVTVECPRDLGSINIPEGSCVLIEELAIWTANVMFCDEGIRGSDYVIGKVLDDLEAVRTGAGNVIIVCDDIFSDGVKYDAVTEEYIRTLAVILRSIAGEADEVIECVSGLCVKYKTVNNKL